jgi:hypothetical protein
LTDVFFWSRAGERVACFSENSRVKRIWMGYGMMRVRFIGEVERLQWFFFVGLEEE